jgi:transmembrane sensor
MSRMENDRPKSLDDEAVGWLVRVQSDAATADDWIALTAWLEAAPDHLAAFDQVERLSAQIAAQAGEIVEAWARKPATVLAFAAPRRAPRRRWVMAGALAAAALAIIVAGPWMFQRYEGTPTAYRTAVGETREIALVDGTRIHLDAASSLSVRLGLRQRRVRLDAAQASFDVAKAPGRPFIIAAGDQEIRVVGTEFNVRHFDRTLVVTVRRGVVEVNQPSLDPVPVARLVAGDQLRHTEGATGSTIRRVEPNAAFAWKAGRLVCDDEPLSQIVSDLNRHYPVPVRVIGAAAAKRFSGVLELGDEAVLIHRLAAYLSLTARRTDHGFVLD